jgi:hypothetical protein
MPAFIRIFRRFPRSNRTFFEKQTRDMSCILENIQQGIFTVEVDELGVGRQSSAHLARILNRLEGY